MIKHRNITTLIDARREKAIARGWAKYVCTLEPDEQEPLEIEGYNDAIDNYEVWREAAIQEYDKRQR